MRERSHRDRDRTYGPAHWQARRRAGRVELSRPDWVLIARLAIYAIIFLSAAATVFDGFFVVIGVLAALGVPILMFARMRALTVRTVLRRAHRIVAVVPERQEAHYREAAVTSGTIAIDGERFDPADVELLRVHRIHRTGEHMNRTHHVWLRTPGRIYELGVFPITGEAEALVRFVRAQLPELKVGDERSKADTLPFSPPALAMTVGSAILSWAVTLGAPFMTVTPKPITLSLGLFAVGVGVLAIEHMHRGLMAEAGGSMARRLRRRFRLDR